MKVVLELGEAAPLEQVVGEELGHEQEQELHLNLVDRPTQLICISDIYLLYKYTNIHLLYKYTNTKDIAGQSANRVTSQELTS